MKQNYLPSVLTFAPETGQNSLSMVRALKNAIKVIEESYPTDNPPAEDRVNAALDDLTLMLGAIQR
jgi:hypothetical protein